MKNLKTLCLAFLLLAGTIAQEAQTQAEEGPACNTETGVGCDASDYLGLRTYDGQALNLIDISSVVFIEAPYAQIQHTLVYENNFDEPTDLVFYYNKPEDSIIANISASWDNRDVEAELISQEDAENIFSKVAGNQNPFNIIARGIPAFVVGTVPPGRDVRIQYTIIQPLTLVSNEVWAFSLYSSVAADDDFRTREWNSSADWYGTLLEGSNVSEWTLNVTLSSRPVLGPVLNPTHNAVGVRTQEGNRTIETWTTSIGLDKDFVLFWTYSRIHSPNYIFTKHPWIESDWIFGYTLVPVANNLTAEEVINQILASPTLEDADPDDSDTPVLVAVNSSVTCNNTQGETIFSASNLDGSVDRNQAFQQYFFLTNLVDPEGCRLNITYRNTFTRATTTTRYVFRGFSLARTTDEWHKIAYNDEFEEFEDGRPTGSDLTAEKVTNLAIKYQVEADNTLWVTVNEEDNRIVDDSLKYYFSPEGETAFVGDDEDSEVGR